MKAKRRPAKSPGAVFCVGKEILADWMHGAQFTPSGVAGNALRASCWRDMRSVRSFLHAQSAYPGVFQGFQHARSAFPGTGMHVALFLPAVLAGYALRAFCWRESMTADPRLNAHGAFLASGSGGIRAPCILLAGKARMRQLGFL